MSRPKFGVAPFATVSQLGQYLGEEIADGNEIAQLALIGATNAIQSYCDQTLAFVENDTVVVDGTGSDILLLPEFPVVSVSAVYENADFDTPRLLNGPEAGSSAEWDVTESGLLIRRQGQFIIYENRFSARFGTWPNRRRSVKVTYTHGYKTIPADIQLVCVAAAARTYAQDGATQERVGVYHAVYAGQPATLTADEKRVLDRYRSRRR